MNTLTFEQIADSRFTDNLEENLRTRVDSLMKLLNAMEGVTARHGELSTVEFDENTQLRCRFFVNKTGRKTSWNDIYKAINKVKAVPYKFVAT